MARVPTRSASWPVALLFFALLAEAACAREQPEVEHLWLALGGETFTLELAADPRTRLRGLSGRKEIPRHGGMLFVLPRPERFAMVMRDCPVPIDVAFLDGQGRVVAMHEMVPEPPRREDETSLQYERRLPSYPSGEPVLFAIEVSGGRLKQVGLALGDRVAVDIQELTRRAR